jgi:hypothetical protein
MDNIELKDFAIGDVNVGNVVVKEEEATIPFSTDALEKFDFSTNNAFDIEQNYELVSVLKEEQPDEAMKELVKLKEAKNIIEKDAKRFLNPEFVDTFNKEEENLINMIKKFDPNLDSVRDMTEENKDKVYEIAQYLFNIYQKKLNDLLFYFPLTKEEVKFIFNVFRNKLEYDQNEVFQMKDLKDNYLDKEFEKQEDGNFMTYINVNDLIVFYHLISKYKVKGITQEHYDYLQILTKIGERIKLFNAYNVVVQRLSNDFQLWGGALSVEGELMGKTLEPQVEKIDDINTTEPLHIIKESDISVVNESTGEVIK